jgi:hypothetical protein
VCGVLAPKDLPSRLMIGGVALCGPLVLLVLRPTGWATYGVPGYWGDLVIPTTLACAPLALVALAGIGRDALTSDNASPAETTPSQV